MIGLSLVFAAAVGFGPLPAEVTDTTEVQEVADRSVCEAWGLRVPCFRYQSGWSTDPRVWGSRTFLGRIIDRQKQRMEQRWDHLMRQHRDRHRERLRENLRNRLRRGPVIIHRRGPVII